MVAVGSPTSPADAFIQKATVRTSLEAQLNELAETAPSFPVVSGEGAPDKLRYPEPSFGSSVPNDAAVPKVAVPPDVPESVATPSKV